MPSTTQLVTRLKAHFAKNKHAGIITISTGKKNRFTGREPLLNPDILLNTNTSTEAEAEHAEFVTLPPTTTTISTEQGTTVKPARTVKIVRFNMETMDVHIYDHFEDYHYTAREKALEYAENRRKSKVKTRCEGVCKDMKRRAIITAGEGSRQKTMKVAGNLFL